MSGFQAINHTPLAAAATGSGSDSTPGQKTGAGTASSPQERPHSVLIIDDNEDVAMASALMLRKKGFSVRTALDGRKALESARRTPPTVVLLDIGLPDMDGTEVARQLREQKGCRSALIIAISGYGQEEDRRRSRDAGIDHHLVKPVDFEELVALIHSSGRRGA